MKIYLISTCVGQDKNNKKDYIFHFKGVFHGLKINEIRVSNGQFVKKHDYLIELKVINVENNIIYGEKMRAKKLFES